LGNGYGENKIKLYKLVQAMTPLQNKAVEKFPVKRGIIRDGGAAQYGGFLGMRASLSVLLTIDLVGKLFGKGLQVKPAPPRARRSLPPPPKSGNGMQINPPPFFVSWDDYKKTKSLKMSRFLIMI